MNTTTKKMEEESIILKNIHLYGTENIEGINNFKNNVIRVLLIFFFISLFLNIYLYNLIRSKIKFWSEKDLIKKIKKNNNDYKQSLKYYNYNISMDNIEDFFSGENLALLPGNNCPNHDIQTYFFKPKYPKEAYKYNKFQEKNISLKLLNESYIKPTAFSLEENEIREIFLKRLGFELNKNMSIYNLYLTTYTLDKKLEKKINKNLIKNMFQNLYYILIIKISPINIHQIIIIC